MEQELKRFVVNMFEDTKTFMSNQKEETEIKKQIIFNVKSEH